MSLANINPASIQFKKTITFTTVDSNTGNAVTEGYNVSSPVSSGVVAQSISGGKLVIPLTTNLTSTNGSPFLKIWLPTATSNAMYLTYCVQNQNMADGYYDYTTGVPSSYLTALKNWVSALYSKTYVGNTARTLKFTVYGSSTAQVANARTFYITFTGGVSNTINTAPNTLPGGGLVVG